MEGLAFYLTLKRPQLPRKLIIMSISTATSNPDLGGVSSSYEWVLDNIWSMFCPHMGSDSTPVSEGEPEEDLSPCSFFSAFRKRFGGPSNRAGFILDGFSPKEKTGHRFCKFCSSHKPYIYPLA